MILSSRQWSDRKKWSFGPYDKSFIDQACLVKMGYMPTLPDYPGVSQMRHWSSALPYRSPRAWSIQPKFSEISVQNSMDRFGPTRKVSKKMGPPFGWNKWIEWIMPQISQNKWTFELFCALVWNLAAIFLQNLTLFLFIVLFLGHFC